MSMVSSTSTGPLFDGRAAKAVTEFLDEAAREVAQEGVNEVQARLGQVLQNPTGHYRSRVVTDQAQGDWGISDGDVIYGPWLEGVSSRNDTTRFKGYSVFRKTQQWLDGRAGNIAQGKLGRFLPRMGGRR